MESKVIEREIELKQLLFYIWNKVLVILLVGVIMAGTVGLYGYKKEKQKSISSGDKHSVFRDIIDQNKNALYPPDQANKYYRTDQDLPQGAYVVKFQLYVDFNFNTIEQSEYMNYNDIISRLQSDANSLLMSNNTLTEIVNQINAKDYNGVAPISVTDLVFMIYSNFYGSNTAWVTVTDADPNRAQDIAVLLEKSFVNKVDKYDMFDEVKIIEEPALNQYNALPSYSFEINSIIKYIIIGGFAGILLMCGLLGFFFVIGDYIRTERDLSCLGLETFGKIPQKEKMKNIEYKRLSYKISIINDCNRLLFVPIDTHTNITELKNEVENGLNKLKSDKTIITVSNVKDSPEFFTEINNIDAVVFIGKYGKTKFKDVQYAVNEIDRTGKKIIGCIILDAKC